MQKLRALRRVIPVLFEAGFRFIAPHYRGAAYVEFDPLCDRADRPGSGRFAQNYDNISQSPIVGPRAAFFAHRPRLRA
jgi:hypothetical protein